MSEADNKSPENIPVVSSTGKASEHIPDTRQRDLGFPAELRELIGVERERIESANRRTEVARYAIEMNDASDKRQFDFQMEQLNRQAADSKRKHGFAVAVATGGFVVVVAMSSLLLGMAFFGTSSQADMAVSIMKSLGLGVAGYGIIGAIARAVRALLNQISKTG